jgi:glycosyltransferase involved in cell wall biosynthesis
MKILLVVWAANRMGGAEVYSESLALGLSQRGHQVTIACYEASPRVQTEVRVVNIPRPQFAGWRIIWRLATQLLRIHWSRHLGKLQGCNPDVIVFSPSVCYRAIVKRFPGVPTIYLPHSRIAPLEVADGLPTGLATWLARRTHHASEREASIRCAAIVRFTPSLARLHLSYYNLPPTTPIAVIPQAIHFPSHPPNPRRGACRAVAVGRLVASKNLPLLVSGLRGIPKNGWKVDIVGDGPQRSLLEANVAAASVQDCVAFHGHQNDPNPFFETADFLAFPSRLENFSLVVLEAMAHGVPALVMLADNRTYFNVHSELLCDGIDGFIAEDEADFHRRMRSLLLDPQPARALAAAARKKASPHAWPLVLDEWESLLARITHM